MSGDDSGLLVIPGGVPGQLEDLGTEVLEDRGKIDGGTGTHTGGVLALTQITTDTTYGELQAGLLAARDGFLVTATSLSFSCDGADKGRYRDVTKQANRKG